MSDKMSPKTKKRLMWGGGILAVAVVLYILFRPRKAAASTGGGSSGTLPAGNTPTPQPSGGGGGSVFDIFKPVQTVDKSKVDAAKNKVNKVIGTLFGPVSPDKPPSGPNPLKPFAYPKQGQYYAVKKGDALDHRLEQYSILKRAGFSGRMYPYKQAMINHPLNAWIPKEGTGAARTLKLYQRYAPSPGHESKPWAHDTKFMSNSSSAYKWPVVYVPLESEVKAL